MSVHYDSATDVSDLSSALQLADQGIPIHPRHWFDDGKCSCKDPGCKHPGKHDHPCAGTDRSEATTDPDVIWSWKVAFPEVNFGTPESFEPGQGEPDTRTMKEHALGYAARGWKIFPIWWVKDGVCACKKGAMCDRPGKHPISELVPNGFKNASGDPGTIDEWWTRYPNANIAVATGAVSNLVVLDIDGPKGEEQVIGLDLPPTVAAKSGREGGGRHLYYEHPGFPVKSDSAILGTNTKVDSRGDGGYIILPPSNHESGNLYEWTVPPDEAGIAKAPDWLIEAANMREEERNKRFGKGDKKGRGGSKKNGDDDHDDDDGEEFITEARNVWLTQKAGMLRRLGLDQDAIRAGVNDINHLRCRPPLPQCEVDRIAQNASNWIPPKKLKTKALDQPGYILALADEQGVEYFRDTMGVPYAAAESPVGQKLFYLSDDKFREYLTYLYYQNKGLPADPANVKKVVAVALARAQYEGAIREVLLRHGNIDGAVWLDLGRDDWMGVRITAEGWTVDKLPMGRFARTGAMKELPIPIRGGRIEDLRPFLNTATETDFILAAGWLAGSMNPGGPRPILDIAGEQGSGKTNGAKILRAVWDDNEMPLRKNPGSEKDLKAAAVNNPMLIFDNLSFIDQDTSDAFCGLSTGSGFADRALYTNTDESVFKGTRPIIFTSITEVANKPDLLDRTVVVKWAAFDGSGRKRITEAEFWPMFEAAHPGILGALCDGVSAALKYRKEITFENTPRMADFAAWTEAATRAWGWKPGTFISAYQSNRDDSVWVSIEASPIGLAILGLMYERAHETWTGTPSQLLIVLEGIMSKAEANKALPSSVNALGTHLRKLAPHLKKIGIEADLDGWDSSYKRERRYTITDNRVPENQKGRPEVKQQRQEDRENPNKRDTSWLDPSPEFKNGLKALEESLGVGTAGPGDKPVA